MLTIPGEAHFWTLKEDISIPEADFGAFRYHEKKDAVESLYLESKKVYAEGRGITWAVSNKKSSPVKKEALKELEDHLSNQRVVRCEWRRHDLLQILLSSGLLINISVSGTGDIVKISSDKYLIGKLPSECITDVVYGSSHVILAFSDSVVSVVHLTKPLPVPEKLSRQEPKMATFDLGGPSGRRLERKLSLSLEQNMVLVWWKCAQDEVYPWSPVVRDCDRANLLVYSLSGCRVELLCFYKTEADPVNVAFSSLQPSILHLVEQKVSRKGEVSIESCRFEVCGSRMVRASSVGALQLATHTCCIARSPDETRLALGCIDGSVLLQSPTATLLAKAAFIPYSVAWHSDGTIVVAANDKGQVQCWDISLAPIRVQLLSEQPITATLLDLTVYFRYQPTLCSMTWSKKAVVENLTKPFAPSDGFLLLFFERGPLTLLRLVGAGGVLGGQGGLTPDTVVSQYLRLELADNAINLLGSLSWNLQGSQCLACMHRVCNHLLAKKLSPILEEQLEAALGTFMSPSVPLSLAAEREYGRVIHHLARKFFHHLLRYQRFEKAFRLAIDLGDRDLFIDMYHYARNLGDDALAQAAMEKAEEVAEGSTTTASSSSSCQCSRSSCSECGTDSASPSSSDTEPETYMAKPTKVTFSDTVTHIVDISSGDEEEEEEDDEESERQSLIVSDTPLRSHDTPLRAPLVHPSRTTHKPQSSYPPDHITHPKYLMTDEALYMPSNSQSYSHISPQSKHKDVYSSVHKNYPSLYETNAEMFDPGLTARNCEVRSSIASIVSTSQIRANSAQNSASSSGINPNSNSLSNSGYQKSKESSALYPTETPSRSSHKTSEKFSPDSAHSLRIKTGSRIVDNSSSKSNHSNISDKLSLSSFVHVSPSKSSPKSGRQNPSHHFNNMSENMSPYGRSSSTFVHVSPNTSSPKLGHPNQSPTSEKLSPTSNYCKTSSSFVHVSPSKSSPKSSHDLSSNSRFDGPLNLHIAKTSVTTLTDTATQASVTRVSEAIESYSLSHLHPSINPLSIQSSDIFITSPGINQNKKSENSSLKVSRSTELLTENNSSHDMSLYSFEVTPEVLQKSVSLSSVASAFPLLNIHGNATSQFIPPPLTVKPLPAKTSHPLYLKPYSPPNKNQREIEQSPNLPLLRLSNPNLNKSSSSHVQNEAVNSSPKVSSKPVDISKSNGVSKPPVSPKPSFLPPPNFIRPGSCISNANQKSSSIATTNENSQQISSVNAASSQPPELLPQSLLGDKLILRKFGQGQEVAPEEDESLANIKVVHFGVV